VLDFESGAQTHRTSKALRAKFSESLFRFREALGVRTRPASLSLTSASWLSQVGSWLRPAGSQLKVRALQ
jgi:hypothetical protein